MYSNSDHHAPAGDGSAGRRGVGGPLSWAGGLLALALLPGCTTPPRTSILHTGDPVIDGNAERAAARPQDYVMWDYRIAAAALRSGDFEEAKVKLDDAIRSMGGIINNSADAARARGLFSGENAKVFIGEPYERVMAYYYRGMLYWREGEPDNARACFRTGQFIDADAETASYRSDYVLLDYLDGLASAKLSADGSEALMRARANAQGRTVPDFDPSANVLIFAEYGAGPRKYAGGEYGEQLRFIVADSPANSARLTVDGQTIALPAYDDLNYQATTRGGRVMDHILGNKAVFKRSTDSVGDVALLGGIVAAENIHRYDGTKSHDAENAAIALGAIGLLSKIASAATTPDADTRMWHNLPQRLSFAAVRLPVGQHPAKLEFLDHGGQVLAGMTKDVTIVVDDAVRDTVVFLSELKR